MRISRRLSPLLVGLTVFCAGVLLALAMAAQQQRQNEADARESFDALAEHVAGDIVQRMHLYEYGLRGARGLGAGMTSTGLTRKGFARYSATRDIATEFPGARGFGFIRRVPRAEEAAFVAAARADDWPDFAIRQIEQHDAERWVIQYIEPVEANRAAVGLDIASEINRRQTADAAMRRGQATLSAPITLVQAAGRSAGGFLLMLPMYRPGMPLDTEERRIEATIGWTYAPLVIDEMLRGLEHDSRLLTLSLQDVSAAGTRKFYGHDAHGPWPTRTLTIELFGRTWSLAMQATPQFIAGMRSPPPGRTLLQFMLLAALCGGLGGVATKLAAHTRAQRLEQARRAAIVEGSDDAIVVQTLDGIITDWNGGAERLFGFAAAEALGQTASHLLVPAERESEDISIRATVARGERVKVFETLRRHRDGTLIEVSISASPIRAPDGRCIGAAKILRDVREARLAERRVRELNASLEDQVRDRTALLESARHSLQTVLDTVPSLIGYWDADMRNVTANRAHRQWFGIDPQDLRGMHVRDMLGPERFALSEPYLLAALHGEPQTYERSTPTPDGRGMRHALVHYLPDVVDGVVRGFHSFVHDVTELTENRLRLAAAQREGAALLQTLRQQSVELQSTLAHLHAMLDASTQVAIIASKADGRISLFNKGAELLLGHAADEVIGLHDATIWHDRDEMRARAAQLSERSGRAVKGGMALIDPAGLDQPWEWTWIRKDGSRVPVLLSVTRMQDDHGQLLGYLGVAHDITAQREHERSLHAAMQQARQASLAKSAFLANMSHEIRTPMNAVIGLSHLLERTPLDADQADMLSRLNLAGKSLLALLNDVLDLSKIEAGEMVLESAAFELPRLLDELGAVLGMQAQQKGIGFVVDRHPSIPRAVRGDSTRLRQVLMNLLSNAIKFTSQGSVRLSVNCEAGADAPPGGEVALRFEVEDTGIGIDPAALSRLFEPFVQADTSTTRRFGGTGLGLSIVRQLVDLMGGELAVRSTPGIGSVFTVDLRLEADELPFPDEMHEGSAMDGQALAGLRILVVDDNVVNQDVARRILEAEGAQTVIAGDGLQAVELLARPGEQVDAVLMDVQMPVLDGLEATRRIRGELGLARLPVVGLTAGVSRSERDQARAAGMNEVLGKPFDPEALVVSLRRAAGLKSAPAPMRSLQRERPADWPAIDGIDADDAFRRTSGDVVLFRSGLQRMLRDAQALGERLPALPQAAARLHDLKGLAGTLGAQALHRQLATAESACRAGDSPGAQAAWDAAHQLVQGIAAALPPSAPGTAVPTPQAGTSAPLERDDLEALLRRLAENDLDAPHLFARMQPALQALLGLAASEAVRASIERLDFGAALRGLAPLQAALPVTG